MATQEYYYKITDLHDLANRESIYALDGVETESGPVLTDKHVLGMDEDVFYKRMLKSAATAVFKRIHRRGRGVTGAYQFDVERESVPGYVIFTLSFPDNFDENLITPIDTFILDALIYHTLYGWFKKCRRNYLSEEYLTQYNDAIDQLKSMIEMRTLVRRPSYFWGRYYIKQED